MTWGVVIVMCYASTGCRVVPIQTNYPDRWRCEIRAVVSEGLHRQADFVSAICGRRRKA